MEYLAASRVYPVVSPAGLVGRNANARLRGWPGLCITIAECVPGHGPVAHNHTATLETFSALTASLTGVAVPALQPVAAWVGLIDQRMRDDGVAFVPVPVKK